MSKITTEQREKLKEKMKIKMEQKRIGRMTKPQKQQKKDEYFTKLGIDPEQFTDMQKQLEQLKNHIPTK